MILLDNPVQVKASWLWDARVTVMFFAESLPWCGIVMQVIASPHPCRVHATLVDKGDCGQGAVHKVTKGWFTLPRFRGSQSIEPCISRYV